MSELPKSLDDSTFKSLVDLWESQGYVFLDNGYLPDDYPVECPVCGERGTFYALWRHPTIKEPPYYGDNGEVFQSLSCHSISRCDECGYEWDTDWFNET